MSLLPRNDFCRKKNNIVFSCLVLIGWKPSVTASKRLFMLPSWKPSSTEIRKWPTTEHTDGRLLGPVWSLLIHQEPWAWLCALSTWLGSEQMHPPCLDHFSFQTSTGPAPWVQTFQERLRSPPARLHLPPSVGTAFVSLLLWGDSGLCKEGREMQWPAN